LGADTLQAEQRGTGDRTDGQAATERLLDPFVETLACGIAGMPGGSVLDCRGRGFRRYMQRFPQAGDLVDEVLRIVALVWR
jgi:hypothetical protein